MSVLPVSRRHFIGSTVPYGLAAMLAAGIAPSILRAQSRKPAGKLGLALVGLGGFAERSIAPEIAASKHVWLAGAVTGDPAGKGKAWAAKYGFPENNLYRYDQMESLRDNPDIDFVHIATPNGLHAEHAIAAARAGKHVLVEKPMAISARECEAMVEACRKAGVLLGVNYRLHWEPHHVKMMELAQTKQFGAVKMLTTDFSWRRGDAKPWLLDKALAGGGAFFDTGCYTVQAGCYITGEIPSKVTAIPTSTRSVYSPGMEETMSVISEFPGGVVMSSRASYAYNSHDFTVGAEKGAFSCEGIDGGSTFAQSVMGKPNPKVVRLPKGEIYKADDTLQLAVLADAFAEAIMNKADFKAPGEMGLRDLRIVEAVYRSAQGGRSEMV